VGKNNNENRRSGSGCRACACSDTRNGRACQTTTKTEIAVPEAGRVPVAKRATGVPAIVVPSAPTNIQFNFHLLIFTEDGEKQQRKPTM